MIAFTILGLVVFWAWCFQAGYCLAFVAQLFDGELHVLWRERETRRSIDVYTGWLVARAEKRT